MKLKKILYTLLLIIWMATIFLFSNQDATTSQSTSDIVTNTVMGTVENITSHKAEKDTVSYIVRKTTHFTVYFILGILACLTLTNYNISKPFIYAIIFCILYACSDEFHQRFLEGRSSQILDVCIDSLGSMCGILLYKLRFKK